MTVYVQVFGNMGQSEPVGTAALLVLLHNSLFSYTE